MTRYQKNRKKYQTLLNFLGELEDLASKAPMIPEGLINKMIKETKARLWEIENDSK